MRIGFIFISIGSTSGGDITSGSGNLPVPHLTAEHSSRRQDRVERYLKALETWFQQHSGVLVAFSGGVDSSLVAFLARKYLGRDRVQALISASPSLKVSDLEAAKSFARTNDIALKVIVTSEIENPDYFENPRNRCYFCKHTLYDHLQDSLGENPGWSILNGTNSDDLGDYRPGLQAAKEFKVYSPLADCGIDKETVRKIAEHFSLSCWDKPASPCLASRVPYGQRVTTEKLKQIELAEDYLTAAGFTINRVRHYGKLARIEAPLADLDALRGMYTELAKKFSEIGFEQIEIDAEGFVSGKLNHVDINPLPMGN